MASPEHTIQSMFERTSPEPNSGCWLWLGHLNHGGYARVSFRGKGRQAHRVILWLMGRSIESGQEVDHLCKNPSCINPDHLEVVSRRVNIERSNGITKLNTLKTHCPKGHPYTKDNLRAFGKRPWRGCKACHRERETIRREQRKVAA